MPDRESFFREYVFKRQPVVITDLFDGHEVSTTTTIDDAVRAWGSMQIHVQEEYSSGEGAAPPTAPSFMPYGEYVAYTRSNPLTRLCCTEYETPARVLASFQIPAACRVTAPPEREVFGLPKKYGDFDLATNVFIANQGNFAHLHFDGDQREVLLYQVYGRKRVVLFQPPAAIHLRVLDGPYSRPSFAGISLENMDLEEKLSWVEVAEGYHTVLEPGETIYIPMLMWHYLEYLDDAMSFSVRFGRTHVGRFLSVENFHRDPYIQNVASKVVGTENVLADFDPIVEEIKTAYRRPTPDLWQRVRDIRALFRGLCAQVCPEASAERLCPPEREEEQISRIVEGKDMKGRLKYADPEVLARARPTGAITSRQREIIRDGITTRGYSKEVERAVVFNRLGKTDVDELTKAEAAQLIVYLNTPGATW